MELKMRKNGASYDDAVTAPMLWARIADRAMLFRNVDFPDALEPVRRTGRPVSSELGTASESSG